ncbi:MULTISPECIES: Crp/Fnr family transcriptional regulator [unclassified Chryseobacterium]|uniref:Crp/Fnr family transcriptional regulator n=1 Tax=unclassified Chryseobacterium TaxID=2593645 RepID=UPI001AE79423|nr:MULTISPECIES: Crp/Fnr family transcriptional regulator [unclassified Chryseobacterium]MBP1163151.1 CRP-like cAMP-binding protein [Chryseobacterium sp. PvR013]MDR4892580.1 Crp/Fnr family transcriptional regulator [Chryseobacterium sp. CFS7]
MKEFIEYILQFGHLNQQQIDLITSKAKEIELSKDEYFAEAGKVLRQVGFLLDGILRICYYNSKGEEITKIFLEENHLLFNLKNVPSTEYIQAATHCQLLVFSNQDWKDISDTIIDWENIIQKITNKALAQKLERVSPLVAQDATTRYLEFMEKYPTLVNRIPLSYIASYLGITQQSLSRIRKNIR